MKEKVEQIEKNQTTGPEEKKDDKLRKVIIVLLILLILSLLLLAGRYLYLKGQTRSASTSSGNLIEEGTVTEEHNGSDSSAQASGNVSGTSDSQSHNGSGETGDKDSDETIDNTGNEPGGEDENGSGGEPEEGSEGETKPSSGGHWVYTSDADLELYSTSTEVNAEFQVENMLPGDRERRFFV